MNYSIYYYLADDDDLSREHFEQKMQMRCEVHRGTLRFEDEELVIEGDAEEAIGIRVRRPRQLGVVELMNESEE